MNQNFNFFVPLELEKAKDDKGKEKMVFKGIASTIDKDSDGEFLDPKGFELDYFLKSGFTNWNHQSKNNPLAIIGEPTKATITSKGLYIETELYADSKLAKEVWDLAKAMDKSGSKRKLGFSIEGKKLEVDPTNDKIIKKAKITGVAITPTPKNANTFADICKGEYSDTPLEYEEEIVKAEGSKESYLVDLTTEEGHRITVDKSMCIKMTKALSTVSGAALKKEDLEGGVKKNTEKKMSKGEVYEKIFYYLYDIEKANQVYELIQKLEIKNNPTMDTKDSISQESINKAFETLGITKGETTTEDSTTVEKGTSGNTTEELTMEKAVEVISEHITKGLSDKDITKAMEKFTVKDSTIEKAFEMAKKKKDDKKDGDEEKDGKKGKKEETEKSQLDLDIEKAEADLAALKVKKENPAAIEKAADFSVITDLIKSTAETTTQKIGALGIVSKAAIEKADAALEALKGVTERLSEIENTPAEKKSITTKNYIKKGDESELEKGKSASLSVIANKHKIVELVDSLVDYSKIEKGDTDELAVASANALFESTGNFSDKLFSFISKKAPHVQLVK